MSQPAGHVRGTELKCSGRIAQSVNSTDLSLAQTEAQYAEYG